MKIIVSMILGLCFLVQAAQASKITSRDLQYAERKKIQAQHFLNKLKNSENAIDYIQTVRKIHRVHKSAVELYLNKRDDRFLDNVWLDFLKNAYNFSVLPKGKTAREKITFLVSRDYLERLETRIRKRIKRDGFKRFIEMGTYELTNDYSEFTQTKYSASAVLLSHYRLLFHMVVNDKNF